MKDLEKLNEQELVKRMNDNISELYSALDNITLTGYQYRYIQAYVKDIAEVSNQMELLRGKDEEH